MPSPFLAAALAFVWRPDFDGQAYHVTNHDTGYGTAWGVTEATWSDAVKAGLAHGPLDEATQSECGLVLERFYWDRCWCDELGAGVGLVVFNMAMVSGVHEASLTLQRAVGASEDGVIGEKTVAAACAMPVSKLVTLLTERDEEFFAGLASAKWFLNGWDRRAAACQAVAVGQLSAPLVA